MAITAPLPFSVPTSCLSVEREYGRGHGKYMNSGPHIDHRLLTENML